MIDYHLHPGYSIDAEGALEEFCEVALSRGLKEIAFTTHLDADRRGGDHYVMVGDGRLDVKDGRWLEDYESQVRSIGDRYKERGLTVLLGVELDFFPGVEDELPQQFFSADFDIILGSIHLIDHIAISAEGRAEKAFRKYSVEELGSLYYGSILSAVKSGLFDVLAHLDLYRRFGERFYGESIRGLWTPHIDELAATMKRHNVGFEVNTSPWRRGSSNPMPAADLLHALIDRGVTKITVGSDAHTPGDTGEGVERALGLLAQEGVGEIAGFTKRQARSIPIAQ